jgi:hypothetical protein
MRPPHPTLSPKGRGKGDEKLNRMGKIFAFVIIQNLKRKIKNCRAKSKI